MLLKKRIASGLVVLWVLGLWGCGEKPASVRSQRLQALIASCSREAVGGLGLAAAEPIPFGYISLVESRVLKCMEDRETDPGRKERLRRWALTPDGPRGFLHRRPDCQPLLRVGGSFERYWTCLGVRLDLLT